VGKCALFDLEGRFAFSNHLTRLRPRTDIILGNYLARYLWLLWQRGEFEDKCKHWVNQSTLPKEELLSTSILVPPLGEQRRIVAKLEKLLGKVEACQKRLARIPVILKRFRQSVLSAACSGRLTADWRNKNDGDRETNGGLRKVDEEVLGTLPNSWTWGTVESVCEHVVDCPHSTPVWTTTGFLCVRTSNFKAGLLDLTEVRYVSPATYHERIDRLTPRAGDVLYSREGAILGIACPVPSGIDLCLGQRMMLFRTKEDYSSSLLMHWLNGPLILKRVRALTGGSASPHLNVRDIKSCPVPLPPRSEQQEIIRRVQTLFKTADQIEARYRMAKSHIDKLPQSVLAQAFRGELVPTEAEFARREGPNDSELN